MPGNAPVDRVGGTKDAGPWPEHVEEIVEGDSHTRPVPVRGGGVEERTVNVQKVAPVTDDDGTDTGGTVVRYTSSGGES